MGAIYLVRHGQASFGAADYDALSPLGVEQAGILGLALKQRGIRLDRIACGPMRRHRQTAEACLAGMSLSARWDEHPGWKEYDHDEMIARFDPRLADPTERHACFAGEADPRRAFQAMFEQATERWISGEHDGDYAESWPAFNARVTGALRELVTSMGPSQTALVFTSGGPVASTAADLLHVPLRDAARLNRIIANASVTKLIYSDRGLYLSTFNEHAHFEGERSRQLITYR
ncbi:MAG: Broad specificity phosphatase PhoE [Hydrocarboniphaga sp.]|uniref:histidine phosphatase family protein n=1 Tax=Hydrocarboniphaga sp. TaxID=2033016 RepID=UPI00260D15E4|nr:histidine phosphatase family protein [Hydrocarboniphaga sp.]MDB5971006.1 Broad specificity phosphatase PhoE [Hydrocarboniphaga sp.]